MEVGMTSRGILAVKYGTFLAVLFLLVLTPTSGFAQGTEGSDLLGTVRDSSGASVAGAKVIATHTSTNVSADMKSDDSGNFAFRFLPPGRYSVRAEMSGFNTVTVTDVILQVNINATITIVLKPASISESLTVKAETNRIETTDATVKHSITNEQVLGLPVLTSTAGRSVLNTLPFLAPGVVSNTVSGEGGSRGEQISINGSRPSSVSFNFEGGDNNDHEGNRAASPLPNPDALGEFTIVTNNYKADLGRSSGGVINAVTKGGTNEFHGNLRYFLVNEALNARGFFDPVRPRSRLNTFGGNIGGPVKLPWVYNGKDKTFFFVDYEGTRSDRQSLYNRDLLSERERRGDFSNLPVAQQPVDPVTRQPFQGGIIPDNRISPVAKEYLSRYIPSPNTGERNYRALLPTSDLNDGITARVDHKIGQSDTISGTYFYVKTQTEAGSTTNIPIGSQQNSYTRNHNFVLRETHVFSDRWINQFIGTITRYTDDFRFLTPGADGVSPAEIGITGVHPQTEKFLGVPTLVIAGTGVQLTTGGGSTSAKTAWQIKDDVSYTRGAHSFKFGGEMRSFIFNKYLGNANGSFNFSNANTFGSRVSIADFLLGVPNSFSQNTGNVLYPRQHAYYFYGLDDWRVTPNLTLNFGLRYELVPNLVDENDQFNVFRPGEKSQLLPQAPLGVLFIGDPDSVLGTVPPGVYPTDKNNFAPRFGLAYTPRSSSDFGKKLLGEGKTVIRLGAGVFYDQTYGFSATQYSFTQPFSVTQSLAANQINAAGGTYVNPFGTLPNPWPLDLSERTFTGTPQLQPFDPTFRTAYTYQYNFTIQRELPWSLLVDFGYVGNISAKLNRERELNWAVVGPGATTANVQARRIYQQFGSIPSQESTGRARYDSFQVRLTRRFAAGLALDSSYVFAKALDNGSNPQVSQLVLTNPLRWARSSNDRRHNFVASYTYAFPKSRASSWVKYVADGWQIGGITQFRSGVPMDISQIGDTTLSGRIIGGRGNPDLIGEFVKFDPRNFQTIVVDGVARTGNFFFDPRAFRNVTVTDYTQARPGTLGRNVFSGPGINTWAASFIKHTVIAERHDIELRADIDNLFNHANFFTPSLITGATFGGVTSADTGRTLQISLRYRF